GLFWLGSTGHGPAAVLLLWCLFVGAGLFGLWIGLGPVVERYEPFREDSLSRFGVGKVSWALIRGIRCGVADWVRSPTYTPACNPFCSPAGWTMPTTTISRWPRRGVWQEQGC